MKVFMIIGLVTAIILGVLSLLFTFEKIDLESFIENNKNKKNKKAKKILYFINFITPIFIIIMLFLLGIVSYLWGRYYFISL